MSRFAPGRAGLAAMAALPPALLLLAFALRLFRLGDQNVWWDEGLAVWAVRKSLAEATLWTASDVHPPLFFWTLWGWIRLAGESTFAVRYLTVAWSILLCALGYALGRRLAGRTGGLLVLALLALSRFLVWWSMELRMYALAALAVLAAVYAVLVWLDPATARRRRHWALGAYVAAATAALYTVYMTAAALALINLVALGALLLPPLAHRLRPAPSPPAIGSPIPWPWRRVASWLAAQLLVAALFAPWLALALPRMKTWTVISEPATPTFVAQLWTTLLATGASVALDTARAATLLWWLAALALPLTWLAARRLRQAPHGRLENRDETVVEGSPPGRPSPPAPSPNLGGGGGERSEPGERADRAPTSDPGEPPPPALGEGAAARSAAGVGGTTAVLLALFVLVPPLVVWAATQPRSLFYSPNVEARYFLPFAAPVYVLAGWLLARVIRRDARVGAALATMAILVMALVLPPHYTERRLKDAFASMAIAIWSQAEPGDVVLLVSGNRYPLFLYDYDQPWDRDNGTDVRYLAPDLAAAPGRPPVIPFPDKGSDPLGENDWQDRLAEIVAEHPRVWLAEVDRQMQDPEGKVQGWLNEHSTRVLSEGYGANALHLYAKDGQPARVTQVDGRWPGMRAAPKLADSGWQPVMAWPARAALAGDDLRATLFRGAAPAGQVTTTVRLDLNDNPTAVLWSGDLRGTAGERAMVAAPVTGRLPGGARHLVSVGPPWAEVGTVDVRGEPSAVQWYWSNDCAATFSGLRLDACTYVPRGLRPGDSLLLDMMWRPWPRDSLDGADARKPVVFAHLVGPARPDGSTVWAGQDGPPSSGTWRPAQNWGIFDRHVLTVDPAAPPGTYTLEVGLYDPDTGERYPVSGANADPANRRVILGTVEVRP